MNRIRQPRSGIEISVLDDQGRPAYTINDVPSGTSKFQWLDVSQQQIITNVLAEIEGIEFLQPVLFRFGDYDPNRFDYTYDPPDNLFGDGETISSYCRTLSYVFQTTNGPGGTSQEINLQQWEDTFKVLF